MGLDPSIAAAVLAVIDGLHPRRDGKVTDRFWFKLVAEPLHVWRAALPGADVHEVTHLADTFVARFHPVPYADVVDALDALHHAGERVVALSNSPRVDDDLRALGIRHRFDDVLALPPELRKPNPAGFALAAERFGVPIGALRYVGDSWTCDVEGALAAGAVPVWLDRHDDGHDVPPGVRRITTLAELVA